MENRYHNITYCPSAGTGRTKTTRWNGWPRKLYVDLDDFDVEKWEGVVKAARHMLSSWNQTNFLLELHHIQVTNLQQSLEESVMLGHKMQRRCRRTSILSTKYVWNWDMHQQWQWWIHLSKNQTQETTPFSKRGRSYETFTIYYSVCSLSFWFRFTIPLFFFFVERLMIPLLVILFQFDFGWWFHWRFLLLICFYFRFQITSRTMLQWMRGLILEVNVVSFFC